MSKTIYKTFELINKPDVNGIITDDYNNKYTYSSVLKCIKDGEFFYNDLMLRSSLIQGTGEYPDNIIGKMDEFYKDEYKAKFRIFSKYNGINFDKFKIDICGRISKDCNNFPVLENLLYFKLVLE